MTRKIPFALLVAALLISGFAVITGRSGGGSASADALPDPDTMLAASSGRGSPSDVVAFWTERVAAEPDDHISRTELGRATLALADVTGDPVLYADAEAHFRGALEILPDHVGAELGLAAALSAQHRFAEARSIAGAVLARDPDDSAALLAVGDAALELGDEEVAFEAYDRLAALEPTDAATLSRRARRAWLTGDGEAAVELAADALRAVGDLDLPAPDATFYWFQLATYRFETGDLGGAEEALRAGLRIQPDDGASLELLAAVAISGDRLEEAATILEGLVGDGGAADVHGLLADVYTSTGRTAQADAQLRTALEVAARDIDTFPAERRHLAGFLVGEDPQLALELMRLDTTDRTDVAGLDLLAWALHENGRVEEADRVMAQALRLGTRDVEMLYHAGMIAASVGDDDRARDLLSDALAINPRFDLVEAPRAAEALANLG